MECVHDCSMGVVSEPIEPQDLLATFQSQNPAYTIDLDMTVRCRKTYILQVTGPNCYMPIRTQSYLTNDY